MHMITGKGQLTRDDFTTLWARNSGISKQAMKALGYQAITCECGDSRCRGWRMTFVNVPQGIDPRYTDPDMLQQILSDRAGKRDERPKLSI